jgi:hypothetical protein
VESCRVVNGESSDWWRVAELSENKEVIGGELSSCHLRR